MVQKTKDYISWNLDQKEGFADIDNEVRTTKIGATNSIVKKVFLWILVRLTPCWNGEKLALLYGALF